VAVTGGLVVLVYAIVKAQAFGWGSVRTIGLIAAGVVLLAAFVLIERRSIAPLMRLNIFRVRTLAVADGVLLLVASGMFGMFFFASLYVQEILGYSPLRAGLAFLPVTGGIVIGAGIAQQLIRRLGVRNVSIGGITLAAGGLAVLTRLPVHGSYVGDLLVGLLPMSIGMGLTFVPITLLGTGGVSGDDAGLASGLFNTAQQVGGSLGLAILSTLAANQTSSLLHGADVHGTSAAALAARVSGYHVAFAAAAIMLAAGAVILTVVLRPRHVQNLELELGEALFAFIDEIGGRQQLDRALFEALADTFLANDDIRAAHAEVVGRARSAARPGPVCRGGARGRGRARCPDDGQGRVPSRQRVCPDRS
jgi:hypothetical protein